MSHDEFPIGKQPIVVRNAIQRLLKDHHYAETPRLAENAISLIVRLHESGICDEDELVELAALSGGKPLDKLLGADSRPP
ncbi:hypothetical protein [Ciceribacter sp. T2.26MG-112.2]|uniref:hypothetical protein n=1 Tax=Ciceribacter sp. T2.26MG-112.2 TaxID=3137154 RepID=UPI0012B6807A|nr:hypothetical protein [Ciceribacter naphthalenivorans]